MESFYQRKCKFLQRSDRQQLAASTGLTERQVQSCLPVSHSIDSEKLQVKIWFQNRRMKEKKESPVVESSSACSTRYGGRAHFTRTHTVTSRQPPRAPIRPQHRHCTRCRRRAYNVCNSSQHRTHRSLHNDTPHRRANSRVRVRVTRRRRAPHNTQLRTRTRTDPTSIRRCRAVAMSTVSCTRSVCGHAHAQVRTCTRRDC